MAPAYRFDTFELQPVQRQLFGAGKLVAVGARAFDLLLALVERRERLVTKSELMDLVWPDQVVEEGNLPVQMSALRKVLGAQAIATVPGRGYRFARPVQCSDTPGPAALSAPQSPAWPPDGPLIGRDAELQALEVALAAHRLVSLVGPGGIGKTRLARAAVSARLLATPQAQGVCWVDLAALRTVSQAAPAIAHAARLALADGDATDLLVRALTGHELLVVLDNCEHLSPGLSTLVNALLAGAAGVSILATSREALHLRGEQVLVLGPLSVPGPTTPLAEARQHGALALLELRARQTDARFALDDTTLADAVELCRRLDGIALALEMAAARLPLLGAAALLQRLGQRLALLKAPGRDVPERQQTLQATLDWSHALLDAAEQAVLRRLGVFLGRFELVAALDAAAWGGLDDLLAVDALAGLVDHSLVQVLSGEPPHYRLAETTRLYAMQHLADAGEADAAERAHGVAMARRATDPAESTDHRSDDEWLARQEASYDDMAAAFERACTRADADVAAAVAQWLRRFDGLRGVQQDTRRRIAAAHALLPHAGTLAKARLCSFIASHGWVAMGEQPRVEIAREAVALWRQTQDAVGLHEALARFATEAARAGETASAVNALREARALEEVDWSPRRLAHRATHEGWTAEFCGDTAGWYRHMGEAATLLRRAGALRLALFMQSCQTDALMEAGDPRAAAALAESTLAELGHDDAPDTRASLLLTLCRARCLAADFSGAREVAVRAMPLLARSGVLAFMSSDAAQLAVWQGRFDVAARLLGFGAAWTRANQCPETAAQQQLLDRLQAAVATALGTPRAAVLAAEGAALDAARFAAFLGLALAEPDPNTPPPPLFTAGWPPSPHRP